MKFFSLIYQGEVHTSSEEKVIAEEDFSTLMQASEILEKAKEDALTYKKNTKQECETLKEQAKEEGMAEGLQLFNDHLLFFEQEIKKIRHEAHQAILPLALKAARKIVAKELELYPETIVDIVLQALAPVVQSRKIKIYVNKADKDIIEQNRPQIKKIFENLETLSIQERDDVSPGGCVIETESGILNAGIENQWRALETAFEKYMKH